MPPLGGRPAGGADKNGHDRVSPHQCDVPGHRTRAEVGLTQWSLPRAFLGRARTAPEESACRGGPGQQKPAASRCGLWSSVHTPAVLVLGVHLRGRPSAEFLLVFVSVSSGLFSSAPAFPGASAGWGVGTGMDLQRPGTQEATDPPGHYLSIRPLAQSPG